jgi:hypothetical protein
MDREFKVNPHINRLLTAVLRAEVRMTLACWRCGGWQPDRGRARGVIAAAWLTGSVRRMVSLLEAPSRKFTCCCRICCLPPFSC